MDCKSTITVCPKIADDLQRFSHSDFLKKKAATLASDTTTEVETNNIQERLPLVYIKVVKGNYNLSVLAMCNTRSSTFFVDRSILSTLHLQGKKVSLLVVEFRGSQNVKTEKVMIAVLAYEKFRTLTTESFYALENFKLGDQIVDLQVLK